MQERIKPTRSGLFAIELLISVGVFSLCAAICVGLFVRSEVMSQDSANLNRAVAEAQSVAECFKAAGGDLEKTAELTGGEFTPGGKLLLAYDDNWNKMDQVPGAPWSFGLTLQLTPEDGYTSASLSVTRYDARDVPAPGVSSAGVDILSWDIAVLEVAS